MAVSTHSPGAPPAPATRPAPRRDGGVMSESVPLGRVAGIPIGLNWSMLLVFWLITWSLADSLLPDAAPDNNGAAYWGAAIIGGLLFYASLLMHEIGHSLVARRRGVVVEGITLWLFGGVARLRGEASTADAELRIAIVGPAISVVCAVGFALVGIALALANAPALVVAVPAWLAVVNLMLAVFNVLPAFPLDGGRVLRAILWRRRGDKLSATQSAATVGTAFGYLLIAGGFVEVLGTGTLGGLWLMFLGWFLHSAARAEAAQSLMRDALRGVSVGDAMTPDPVVVPDWIVVEELLEGYALQHRFTSFPVRSFEGDVDGLVTLAQVQAVPPEQRRAVRVRDVAWPLSQVPTASAAEPLTDLLERMGEFAATRALVLDGGHVCGIVSPSDVARIVQLATLREKQPH